MHCCTHRSLTFWWCGVELVLDNEDPYHTRIRNVNQLIHTHRFIIAVVYRLHASCKKTEFAARCTFSAECLSMRFIAAQQSHVMRRELQSCKSA
jgi:hypothetical protein